MTTKRIQLLITVVLALVLLVLVASYIYFGMQLAKRTDPVAAAKVETETTATKSGALQLTREEKIAILDALTKDSTTTISNEEKLSVMDKLSEDTPVVTLSDADKQKILEKLSNQE